MKAGYTLGIHAYGLAIRLASAFNPKAKLWISGRKQWKKRLQASLGSKKGWVWFHCSSLGEFEQGRPLMEALKKEHPHRPILLTFFSPSGYEIRKDYAVADVVCYLPLDTPSNAEAFLEMVQPDLVFFIKYDLWLNFLAALRQRSIPHYLVSALLRPDSKFLNGMMKGSYAEALQGFTWVFAQDKGTEVLLKERLQMDQVTVSGDTRFDRAIQLPAKFEEVAGIAGFVKGRRVVVVGSSYAKDEEVFLPVIEALRELNLCWIVAPHNIERERIERIVAGSKERMAVYSRIEEGSPQADVLWIDNIGMLSRLYFYADVVYIGGGFGGGIHNTQEPAVYGNPIFFGPKYDGFKEAVDMVNMGTAFVVEESHGLELGLRKLFEDGEYLGELRYRNKAYMEDQAGATALVLAKISI